MKTGIEKKQEKVLITSGLLRAALARSPWVSEKWQDEVVKLFSDFNERGETAVEVAFEDSDIPIAECTNIAQGCNVYGFFAVREAILNAIESKMSDHVAS